MAASIFATEEFDSISHMHLLLDSPRKGILKMMAIESGDVDPEDWVPSDAASYMTMHWNLQQTLDELEKMFDQFRGEGSFGDVIERRMSLPLGVDFQKEILDQLDDRATHVSWFEKPAKINSGTNLVGIKLKNAGAMQSTLDKIFLKLGDPGTKKNYRGISYHEFQPRRRPRPEQVLVRQPTPCLAIVGDYLLVSDSSKCLEAAITAKRTPNVSFADGLDYKLIASQIEQQLGSREPGMVSFSRPEETMRSFYRAGHIHHDTPATGRIGTHQPGIAGAERRAARQPAATVLGDRQVPGSGGRHAGQRRVGPALHLIRAETGIVVPWVQSIEACVILCLDLSRVSRNGAAAVGPQGSAGSGLPCGRLQNPAPSATSIA